MEDHRDTFLFPPTLKLVQINTQVFCVQAGMGSPPSSRHVNWNGPFQLADGEAEKGGSGEGDHPQAGVS